MNRSSQIIILIFLLWSPSLVQGANNIPRDKICIDLFRPSIRLAVRALNATWSGEFEWEDLAAKVAGSYENFDSSLFNSRLIFLYGFFGRNNRGQWILNYIPPSVKNNNKFRSFWLKNKSLFIKKGQDVFISDPQNLDGPKLRNLIWGLMEVRGPNSNDLKLRKIESEWTKDAAELDRLLPTELSEEWRGDRFANIELPMLGFVHSRAELLAFFSHLVYRLALVDVLEFDPQEAALQIINHIHWVPQITELPPEDQEYAYQNLLGLWGDENDRQLIAGLSSVVSDPKQISGNLAGTVFSNTLRVFKNKTFGLFSRELGKRVRATPRGLIIQNRLGTLDPSVDPNIPPEFKFLLVGLRGLYQSAVAKDSDAIERPGLEFRQGKTLKANLENIPDHLDHSWLIDAGEMGVISNPTDLIKQAQILN